jgi:hypothetical protein
MGERTHEVGIDGLLESLQKGEWRIPQFQREFVWSIQDIEDLLNSVFDARPLGMVTLWALEDTKSFETERISLEDSNDEGRVYFGDDLTKASYCAILDGRQRCTSLAMAFGGLKQQNKQRKFSGSFFLSLREEDKIHPAKFFKSSDVERKGLDTFANALSEGYFHLTPHENQKTVRKAFFEAVRRIDDPEIYRDGEMPSNEEIARRQTFLDDKFSNFEDTKLAVYTVPSSCNLQDICEIFETLNTTGTKVSTVDLVHSFLYADTQIEGERDSGKNLRAWIDELGQIKGAHGWANSKNRPELLVQFVAAIYLTLQEFKIDLTPPRNVGGREVKIENVKNGSLLALPSLFWVDMMKPLQTQKLRQYISEFQDLIGGGAFPYQRCPYPISAGIFIGLRYFLGEHENKVNWTEGQLRSLYRSFFWRNLLSTRYDQGFLTQMSADLKKLIKILEGGAAIDKTEWVGHVEKGLAPIFDKKPILERDQIAALALDGTVAGALKSGLELRLYTRPKEDLLDGQANLEFALDNDVHVHHIFPKNWIKTNRSGDLKKYLDDANAIGRVPDNSAANLMPLSAKSNEDWMDKAPRVILEEYEVNYNKFEKLLLENFIDEECFKYMSGEYPPDNGHVLKFWEHRAQLIADDLINQTRVQAPDE